MTDLEKRLQEVLLVFVKKSVRVSSGGGWMSAELNDLKVDEATQSLKQLFIEWAEGIIGADDAADILPDHWPAERNALRAEQRTQLNNLKRNK